MPPSLRYLSALVATSTLVGSASLVVLYREDRDRTRTAAEQLTGGRVEAGAEALRRQGCGSCHRIRGVDGADGRVGPPLDGIALRTQIAGRLANQPAQMIRWIRFPQSVDPGNGMPDLGVSEREARDMAAYLYTLR